MSPLEADLRTVWVSRTPARSPDGNPYGAAEYRRYDCGGFVYAGRYGSLAEATVALAAEGYAPAGTPQGDGDTVIFARPAP